LIPDQPKNGQVPSDKQFPDYLYNFRQQENSSTENSSTNKELFKNMANAKTPNERKEAATKLSGKG
jgi:hypothetical protein